MRKKIIASNKQAKGYIKIAKSWNVTRAENILHKFKVKFICAYECKMEVSKMATRLTRRQVLISNIRYVLNNERLFRLFIISKFTSFSILLGNRIWNEGRIILAGIEIFCDVFISFDTDILLLLVSVQDYTHEFHKTKGNFLAIREKEDLLGSVRKDIEWVLNPLFIHLHLTWEVQNYNGD